MTGVLNVPNDDRFMVITEHDQADLVISPEYLGIGHTADVVLIQVTRNEGRTVPVKWNFYRAVADGLHERTGLRREDGHDHGSSSGDHNITVAEAKKSAADALRVAFDRQKLKAYLRKLLYQYACTSSSRQPPVSVDRQGRLPPTGRRTHSRDIRRRLSIGGRGCR